MDTTDPAFLGAQVTVQLPMRIAPGRSIRAR